MAATSSIATAAVGAASRMQQACYGSVSPKAPRAHSILVSASHSNSSLNFSSPHCSRKCSGQGLTAGENHHHRLRPILKRLQSSSSSSSVSSFSSSVFAMASGGKDAGVSSTAAAASPSPSPPSAPSEEGSPPADGTSTSASPSSLPQWGTKTPRRFHVRSDQWINILSSSLNFPFRLGSGAFINGYKVSLVPVNEFPADEYASFEVAGRKIVESGAPGPKPEQPIELYEFEGCPFCRKVRELVSILDLDVVFYPTPRDGPTYRPKAIQMGGKSQFPYMIDPNTGESMYESDNIIKYLVEKYGNGKVPLSLKLGPITTLTAGLAMIGRMGKGSKYTPARRPEKPLKLWAYEPSPFCKIVREKLVELELPHEYFSTPRGSRKRTELFRRLGHFQVPYLEDPNTGVNMFESADIVEYLLQTYATSA